jgi:hypothetical protein
MLSLPFQAGFLAAVLLATESLAGPVAFRPSDLEVFPVLQGRSSVITLGDYSLVTSHEDYTLLDLYVALFSIFEKVVLRIPTDLILPVVATLERRQT